MTEPSDAEADSAKTAMALARAVAAVVGARVAGGP